MGVADESWASRGRSPSEQSARTYYDRLADKEQRFAQPVQPHELREPLATVDPLGWLGGDIRGRRVLCLAAGGGRQSALYAAAGADVTVVDISPAMLRLDRQVATAYSLSVATVEGAMDHMPMLAAESFDVVIHPVSTCYVPDLIPVYREVARVLVPGGLYISQHKQPTSLQTSSRPGGEGYYLQVPYFRREPLPPEEPCRHREAGALEYLHRWEDIVGQLCRAGFVIEDLVEPPHGRPDATIGSFAHRSQFVAPYVRIKARRRAGLSAQLTLPDW